MNFRKRIHQPLAEGVVEVSLRSFRLEVSKRWLRVLHCRSQKSRMTWKRLAVFVEQWLPLPRILHPYPYLRFDAKHLR